MNTPHPMKGLHAVLAAADSTAALEAGHVYDRIELSQADRELLEEANARLRASVASALAQIELAGFDTSNYVIRFAHAAEQAAWALANGEK